jgi:hypothetical protein
MAKITAANAGTWLDGWHGWTNGYRAVEKAVEWGWTVPQEYADGWRDFTENHHGDHDVWAELNGDDGAFVDAATEYLQESAPEGYVFRWDDGLSMLPEWSDCAADGNGCEVLGFDADDGREIVRPCRDHQPDNRIVVSPKRMTDEFTTYGVMLWDETYEILSGSTEVKFSPRPDVSPAGEYWFPETIPNGRIREAAEKLLKALRCEGHADDDAALLSGVGIGEGIRCDGSCQG